MRIAAEYTEKCLARAEDEDGIDYVSLSEIRFSESRFCTNRFFVVGKRNMDFDEMCWDKIFNDLRSAMAEFGREANKRGKRGGVEFKWYKKPKYCDDWRYYLDELRPEPEDYHDIPSATAGDYSPSCPWNAPGMSVSDFIRGVY